MLYRKSKSRAAPPNNSRQRSCRTFVKAQQGASAVEFAFILPVLLLLLTGMIDAGVLFMTRNDMVRVAHDAARKLSVSQFTEQEARDYVTAKLAKPGRNLKIEALLPDRDAGEVDVSVAISMPVADAFLIDLIGLRHMESFSDKSMGTRVTMQQELQQ